MKPTTASAKRVLTRPYSERMAERRFVRDVMARKMTPEIEQRLKAGAVRAQAAMDAPFLAKFGRAQAIAA